MKKTLPFRTWYYFRLGWTTYFAFIFAAINTLTVTYYLAIENYPLLSQIFPTFVQYVSTIAIIGIPILVLIGYVHYKRSPAYRSEADITIESNPHAGRLLLNSETLLGLNLELINLIIKISENEKLSEEEKESVSKMKNDLSNYMKKRTTKKMPTIFDKKNE
tara:strand:+ start:201 stop:686 length:486 start_codon:yes stop_codon:yes gene_type:complete